MAIPRSVLGLQKVLRVHTGTGGDYSVDPSRDPQGYGNVLERSYDARVQEDRAQEDAAPPNPSMNSAQATYFKTFNRGQEDAAMGPAGYNRKWAGFLEAPQVLEENNPGTTYRTNYSGMGAANTLAQMSKKRPSQKPMPETHDAFMTRMATKFGAR